MLKKVYNILLPLVVAAMASVFGYEKVQQYRASTTEVKSEVTVNVETSKSNGELKRMVEENRKSIEKWHK